MKKPRKASERDYLFHAVRPVVRALRDPRTYMRFLDFAVTEIPGLDPQKFGMRVYHTTVRKKKLPPSAVTCVLMLRFQQRVLEKIADPAKKKPATVRKS